jgi:hypothetical protein
VGGPSLCPHVYDHAHVVPVGIAHATAATAATGSPVPGLSASLSAGTYTSQVMRPHVTFTLAGAFLMRSESTDQIWLSRSQTTSR